MPRWMVGIGALGTVALVASGQGRMAAGFALGAAIGLLGFMWLRQTVDALLDGNSARVPRVVILKIVLRYALMLAGILFFARTGWLPVLPIFAGLLVPGAGVLIESLRLLGEGFHQTERV
jgi:hypothetical protein